MQYHLMPLKPFQRASGTFINDYKEFLRKDKPRFMEYYNSKISCNETLKDFKRLQTLGHGSFGRVYLFKHKKEKKYYAAKSLDKEMLVKKDQVAHTLSEKRVLQAVNFPFLVYLAYYFTDNCYLYFVLPLAVGGELFTLLRSETFFDEDQARFYAAQVCLGLDYLHYVDLVYRDLKPENIVIDEMGYIKITDFGFSKLLTKGRTYSLCGTPEYLAPELILSKGYGFTVDWWAFGVLIYEMNAGFTPFYDKDHMTMYTRITSGDYRVPPRFSKQLRNLIKNLLQIDLTRRFGNLKNRVDDIKDHRWFKTVNWLSILNKKVSAPYEQPVEDIKEISRNFEKQHEEPIRKSLTDRFGKYFAEF